MPKVKATFVVEMEVEFDKDYTMKDIEEYLDYKIGSASSILTKNPLYKDEAEFHVSDFVVTKID